MCVCVCVHALVREGMFNSFYLLFFNLIFFILDWGNSQYREKKKKINNAADVGSTTITVTCAGPGGGRYSSAVLCEQENEAVFNAFV